MKIKKVDDKPMVIHTKKKAKIHMHEPKKAKIKGSNIYTVQRGPKIASAKINDTGKKKSYRKSTIHQAEKKEKEPSKFKRNIRESNTSIKTKNTNLHIAGRTGALATGAVTEQVEGGQEVSQAAYLAYEAREYGTPEKIKDVYDYRAKLKQKFYFYQDLSKDDDIPKNMQNDFLHQMYKEFGTIEEEYFYDRLEDGKYDEGFKERQVKEKKSR